MNIINVLKIPAEIDLNYKDIESYYYIDPQYINILEQYGKIILNKNDA